MREHNFTLILIAAPDEEAADRLYGEFDDGTLSTITGVPQVHFHRQETSLEAALRTAIANIRSAALTSHGSRSSRKHWHGRRDREEGAEIAAVEVEAHRVAPTPVGSSPAGIIAQSSGLGSLPDRSPPAPREYRHRSNAQDQGKTEETPG
jgi:hypothetical protein